MTDYPLSLRTKAQLLSDFDGRTPPQEKMLNLIHSLFETFDGGGSAARGVTTLTASGTISEATADWIVVDSAEAVTLTLDDDLPIGTSLDIVSIGEGAVSVASEGGAVHVYEGKAATIAGQYAAASVMKNAAGSYVMIGALADA